MKSPVFRPLHVQMFASMSCETLPCRYISEDHYVKWCPDDPKLENRKSCIIPDELPEEDMDIVESVLDCLFLKFNSSLSDLYEFLKVSLLLKPISTLF